MTKRVYERLQIKVSRMMSTQNQSVDLVILIAEV